MRPRARRRLRLRPPELNSDSRLPDAAEVSPSSKGGPFDPPIEEASSAFSQLVALMARLRAPGGCPWDREQTHASISLNLLEEAYETVDAIDRNDTEELAEELGDLLLQVVFHSQMAAEEGRFDIARVIGDLTSKLISRHPHVFGDGEARSAGEVLANWEAIKAEQKGRTEMGEGIPKELPALVYAHKVLRRLAGAGKEYEPSPSRLRKLAAATESGLSERLIGELLFEAAALARAAHIDPEGALRKRAKASLDD